MSNVADLLQRVGLTEYEAKTYLALLTMHLSTATKIAEKAGVPRTRIYSVLEALRDKGWVKVLSGVPLLFRANEPVEVFEKAKADYTTFLESIKTTLNKEVNCVKEKIVVKKTDIGLDGLKTEISKAKTVEISNATAGFLKKVGDAFGKDAVVRVLLFPGEPKPSLLNATVREAESAIVSLVRNKEVPNMSITLDEERIFTVLQDPVSHNYIIDEMLYDECQRCFAGWSSMSWSSSNP